MATGIVFSCYVDLFAFLPSSLPSPLLPFPFFLLFFKRFTIFPRLFLNFGAQEIFILLGSWDDRVWPTYPAAMTFKIVSSSLFLCFSLNGDGGTSVIRALGRQRLRWECGRAGGGRQRAETVKTTTDLSPAWSTQ